MPYEFTTEQWLPYPIETVFAFFANPDNLPRLMPRWQRTRIERADLKPPPPSPDGSSGTGRVAGAGSIVVISARPFPLSPVRSTWEARIEDFRWNEGFCDVQVHGPFAAWRHCHSVRAETVGDVAGTVVQDHVRYELPLGKLNPLANKLAAKNALAYTFRVRQKRTEELLAVYSDERNASEGRKR